MIKVTGVIYKNENWALTMRKALIDKDEIEPLGNTIYKFKNGDYIHFINIENKELPNCSFNTIIMEPIDEDLYNRISSVIGGNYQEALVINSYGLGFGDR